MEPWQQWIPVVAAAVASAATLGGVAITGFFASRRERAALKRADEVALRDELRTTARVVAEAFMKEANAARRSLDTADSRDEAMWGDHWDGRAELPLRLAIEAIPDAQARRQLSRVCDALGSWEFSQYTRENLFWAVARLTELGQNVAATYMRGESPSEIQQEQLRKVDEAMSAVEEHQRLQLEMREEDADR